VVESSALQLPHLRNQLALVAADNVVAQVVERLRHVVTVPQLRSAVLRPRLARLVDVRQAELLELRQSTMTLELLHDRFSVYHDGL